MLNRSFFSFRASSSSRSTVIARISPGFIMRSHSFADALDEARLDRQLGCSKLQSLARRRDRHTIDLEQDAAGLDSRHPVFRRALAGTHANFQWLLRHRHVRKNPDPDPAGTLHMTRERPPRGLDLARRDAIRFERLEAELPKRQVDARGGNAFDPALVRLAKLRAHRLQHGYSPSLLALRSQNLRSQR